MLVKNWMSRPVVTIESNQSMQEAIHLLKTHRIGRLPVLEKGKLVGIVTDRDLKRASASDATTLEIHELMYLMSKIQIKDIMSRKVISVPADFTIEETAEVLLSNNISGVPVLDAQQILVGIITHTDLFKVILSLTGIGKRGIQFAFELEDRPGSIMEVAQVIRSFGGRMSSILTTYEHAPQGFRHVYIRAFDLNRKDVAELKRQLKEKAKIMYIVDHRENNREILI
ncbi:CBS and ACT domain-containing protein [Desulfatirhabdium butyrativorans]|uniref:CBS and ACT domain-containing protein n=1 Tax=Desulfatirhabdium butyrativorans TaxID=340467 RepID=UPI0003FE2200|nr:CBS and ACT domain-containing protein [Desulfatirhabdium butyrativorans]